MKCTPRLARENIKKLKPCVHGDEVWEVTNKTGLRKEEILDFSSSVNPLGPSRALVMMIFACALENKKSDAICKDEFHPRDNQERIENYFQEILARATSSALKLFTIASE